MLLRKFVVVFFSPKPISDFSHLDGMNQSIRSEAWTCWKVIAPYSNNCSNHCWHHFSTAEKQSDTQKNQTLTPNHDHSFFFQLLSRVSHSSAMKGNSFLDPYEFLLEKKCTQLYCCKLCNTHNTHSWLDHNLCLTTELSKNKFADLISLPHVDCWSFGVMMIYSSLSNFQY